MQRTPACLAGAALGVLFLLSQGAPAQTQPPQPGANNPYEWEVVSTASRKMLEVQRETDACVVTDVPTFFSLIGPAYSGAKVPVMYSAMQAAGGDLKGRGPASVSSFDRLYHATSAKSFFNYNVSDNWKRLEAKKLSEQLGKEVKPDSDEVRTAWENAITDGKDIPIDMLMPDSLALPALSWVTPDKRMAIPTAPNRERGSGDFFHVCHILALAPEWYPEGLVNLNYPALKRALIRPVSFDGMLSPLWVQQPPDQPAKTGGDALEAFNRDDIRLSQAGPSQAYIVTEKMVAALNASPSVNAYSVDLAKVAPATDLASKVLGEQQAAIVRQVREARRKADAAFKSVVPTPATPPPTCATRFKQGASLLPSGRADLTGFALQTEMARWAIGHFVQNPAQRFAAERFDDAMARAPALVPSIMTAATALLRHSDRPDVLAMVAQLGRASSFRPYYVALLDRIAGRPRPLPTGPGIRTLTLKGDLLLRLEDSVVAREPTLARQAMRIAKREGRPDLRLAIVLNKGSSGALLKAFAKAVHDKTIDPWLGARVAWTIARYHPAHLGDAARVAKALTPTARRLFIATAQKAVRRVAAR